MQKAAYVYLLTLLAFLALDAVWLGIVAKNFYKKYLGHLMAVDINWTAALLFYLAYIAAILVFVTAPAVKSGFGDVVDRIQPGDALTITFKDLPQAETANLPTEERVKQDGTRTVGITWVGRWSADRSPVAAMPTGAQEATVPSEPTGSASCKGPRA